MKHLKSYTSLEQSKDLAKILPLESADMNWHKLPSIEYFARAFPYKKDNGATEGILPCWSLAALLSVLPKGTNISVPNPINELSYCCWNQHDEIYADNPIDACYAMILKLYEQNIL